MPSRSSLKVPTLGALLALAAGSVAAQSGVTVYGIVDASLQVIDADGVKTKNLVSGGRSGSRFGLRGSEDLGAGLSALFTIEQGINLDTGSLAQGGLGWGRQSFVGLRGPLGTLALGRMATFSSGAGSFDMFGESDPLLTSYGIAGVGSTMSSAAGLRADNTVLYRSPEMSGFQAGLAHSFQLAGTEVAPQSANLHLTSLAARYTTGPLNAVITYDVGHNPAGGPDETHLQLGLSYDFQVVKAYVAYALEKALFSTSLNISGTTNGADAKAWMVGLTAPIGGGTLRASYQARDGEALGGEDRDLRVVSLAYEYPLSKRTMVYGMFADSDGEKTLDGNPTYDRKVLGVGVEHRF